VVACIEFARAESVPVSVRGGGHSFAGKAVCDGGLMIDLSGMKGIEIDTSRRTALAQTGLKLGIVSLVNERQWGRVFQATHVLHSGSVNG
jgi:FAD/FMN-containing dehydrogenase